MDKLKLSDDVMPNSKYKRDRRNAMLETVSSKESSIWPFASDQTSADKDGESPDTGHDFPENPDKNNTRTGHGQYCPPTSASDLIPWVLGNSRIADVLKMEL